MSNSDFDSVQKRRMRFACGILIATPVVLLLAMLSFGMDFPIALAIALFACAVALFRVRLRTGRFPWQPPR